MTAEAPPHKTPQRCPTCEHEFPPDHGAELPCPHCGAHPTPRESRGVLGRPTKGSLRNVHWRGFRPGRGSTPAGDEPAQSTGRHAPGPKTTDPGSSKPGEEPDAALDDGGTTQKRSERTPSRHPGRAQRKKKGARTKDAGSATDPKEDPDEPHEAERPLAHEPSHQRGKAHKPTKREREPPAGIRSPDPTALAGAAAARVLELEDRLAQLEAQLERAAHAGPTQAGRAEAPQTGKKGSAPRRASPPQEDDRSENNAALAAMAAAIRELAAATQRAQAAPQAAPSYPAPSPQAPPSPAAPGTAQPADRTTAHAAGQAPPPKAAPTASGAARPASTPEKPLTSHEGPAAEPSTPTGKASGQAPDDDAPPALFADDSIFDDKRPPAQGKGPEASTQREPTPSPSQSQTPATPTTPPPAPTAPSPSTPTKPTPPPPAPAPAAPAQPPDDDPEGKPFGAGGGETVCPHCDDVVFLTPDVGTTCPFCHGDLRAAPSGGKRRATPPDAHIDRLPEGPPEWDLDAGDAPEWATGARGFTGPGAPLRAAEDPGGAFPEETGVAALLKDHRPVDEARVASDEDDVEDVGTEAIERLMSERANEDDITRAVIDDKFLEDASRVVTAIPELPENVHLKELVVYAIQPPFSYVRLLRDEDRGRLVYEVIEPQLSEPELERLTFIEETLIKSLDINYDDLEREDIETYLRRKIARIIDDYDIRLTEQSSERIQYYLYRRYVGYGPIHVMMLDPAIEDISCDGPNIPVYLFHRTEGSIESTVEFPNHDQLDSFVLNLAQKSGRHISVADPLLDATLPDGSRLQATIGIDVTTRGSTFTIRRFRAEPITPPEIVSFGTLSEAILAYLWLGVQYGRSVVIAGGTASGKTTTLNAASLFIPPSAKIVSIEDTRELALSHGNWIPGQTRAGTGEMVGTKESGAVDMYDLLRAALRQRPEYIVMGEIRGEEANVLFQAMATGHTVFSTMHADSVRSVVHRLESKPIFIPRNLLNALDIVIVQTQVRIRGRRARRVDSITEIIGIDPDTEEILTNETFRWDIPTDRFVFTGKSRILEEVQRVNNWSEKRLENELKKRTDLLKAMRESSWIEFGPVTRLIQMFFENAELALSLARQPRKDAGDDHPLLRAGVEAEKDPALMLDHSHQPGHEISGRNEAKDRAEGRA